MKRAPWVPIYCDMSAMKEINPMTPLTDDARAQIAAIARRQMAARSLLMRVIQSFGGTVEGTLSRLPSPVRRQIDSATRSALTQAYDVAARSREGAVADLADSDRANRMVAALTGAVGGAGGLATSLLEIPVATTMIFRAVQRVATEHGEDPTSAETRLQCLEVFGAGGPDAADDGVDTAFFGARIGLTGASVHAMIARVAPRFAAILGQKLASQAVPLLGAIAGAGTNYSFTGYYTEIAHVHFGLRALARSYGEEQVLAAFHAELARLQKLPSSQRA